MAKKFVRKPGEEIVLEASGVLVAEGAGGLSKMTGGNLESCKLFLTPKRLVCARARQWFGGGLEGRAPYLVLVFPIVWIFTALSKRTILFEIPLSSLAKCTFLRKKGRYRFEDVEGTVSTLVITTFQRRKQARKWMGEISRLLPSVICAEVEE